VARYLLNLFLYTQIHVLRDVKIQEIIKFISNQKIHWDNVEIKNYS
jgi:hypothetical protein